MLAVALAGLLTLELVAVGLHEVVLGSHSLLAAYLAVLVGVVLGDESSLGVNLRCRGSLLTENGQSSYECKKNGFLHFIWFGLWLRGSILCKPYTRWNGLCTENSTQKNKILFKKLQNIDKE